ncbi:hypothetical protein GCM10020295_73430 [Streptomyces cinereospinus]
MIRSAKWLWDRWNDFLPYALLPSPFAWSWPLMTSLLPAVGSAPDRVPRVPRFVNPARCDPLHRGGNRRW